jgi:uncharacterized protein GlcG (DUF336 family)
MACANEHGTATAESISSAITHVAGAQQDITLALPHTDSEGQGHLTAAQGDLTGATADLSSAKASNAQQMKEESRAVSDLKAEREHWLGYRLRKFLWWIIGGATLVWVITGVAGAFLPIGGLGSTLLRLLPFANPWAFLRDRFIRPAPVVAAKGRR